MSFISFSFVILFLLVHANIFRTPLCMFDQSFLRRFFAPAPSSEASTGLNIEIHQVRSYAFLLAPSKVSMGITTGSRSWPNFLFGSWPNFIFRSWPENKNENGSWPGSLTPNTNRNLQNEWLILYVVMVFIFSLNFTLKSGGMGNFFCLECFSKEKPAAMLV